MRINTFKTLIYKIELSEDEVKALISSLSIAKADWNISDIANEVLEKLKKVVDG
jgi:hypothetical protein